MVKISIIVGVLLITSGILFLIISDEIPHTILFSYCFASSLILASGTWFIIKSKDSKVSIFVCGECDLRFLNELELRKHYVTEHVKKDSDEKKS